MNEFLSIRENVKSELLALKTVEEGLEHLNKIKGIEAWVKAEKLDAEIQVYVKEQSLRAKRFIGQLLKDGQEAGEIAGRGNVSTLKQYSETTVEEDSVKTISELGLTHKQSAEFQKLASIPDQEFENHISDAKEEVEKAVNKLSTAAAVTLADDLAGKVKPEKADLDVRTGEIIYEINQMPVKYRLKIKQHIK